MVSLTEHYVTAQTHEKISVVMKDRYSTNLELIKIVDDLIYLEMLLTYWTHRN